MPHDPMSTEPMHRLIRLKRYEKPPEGYYEDFLREFHQRQRAELLKPSLSALIMERISGLMNEIRVPMAAYAGVTALAVVAGIAIMRQNPNPAGSPAVFAASYSQNPVTIGKMQPVSLRVDVPGQNNSPTRFLPPSFLLQARPASHESPLSF